ncbi:MAG: hypothetical protein AAGA27_04635, partial [Pseudomonadota bacterium]
LSSLFSTLAAYYFSPHNTSLLLWAIFFGLFLGLYRVGESKIQQIFSLLCYIWTHTDSNYYHHLQSNAFARI